VSRKSRIAWLLVLGHAALSASAFAQSSDDTALATELFNAGRALMHDGNYAQACPKLAESARLDAKVGTLVRLGECEEKLGHLVPARAHWQQALNLARTTGDTRIGQVEEGVARIDKVVPKLVIVVASDATDVVVRLDGREMARATLGVAVPVEPGTHAVVASAEGKKTWSGSAETKADGAVTTMTVPPLQSESSGPPLPTPNAVEGGSPSHTPAPVNDTNGRQRIAGLVTGGVGLVAAGVGAVLGLEAISKNNDTNGSCVGDTCSATGVDARLAARTLANASTVSFLIGGAGVASGLALYFGAPRGLFSQRNVALGLGTLGLVTMGVGAGFAFYAKSKNDDSAGACQGLCMPDGSQARRDALSAADNATVAFVAGGALAAGGVVLWLAAPSGANIAVTPVVGAAPGLTVRAWW
jgi:hypothetical protein